MVVADNEVPKVIAEQETPVEVESPEEKVLREKTISEAIAACKKLSACTQDTRARNSW